MMNSANGAAANSYFEHVLNCGDMSVADQIFSPDIQFHYPLGELSGSEAVKSYVGAVRTAFPDIHFNVTDLISEGDRVASRWSLVGSQTGEFKGKAPTNKKVSVPGITIMRFAGGMIEEMWIAFDPARLTDG